MRKYTTMYIMYLMHIEPMASEMRIAIVLSTSIVLESSNVSE